MDKQSLKQRLANEILILDGAQGTMIQPYVPAGYCYDLASVEKPDVIAGMYKAYTDAGADIVTTNTFGASSIKLQSFGLADRAAEINHAAARLAKQSVGAQVLVAGCLGPTGKLITPMGPLSFDETYEAFREQASALAEGGADLFLLETFSDIKEAKIAVMAARDTADLPILCSITYEESFMTFLGTDPATAASVLLSLGVDVLGVNCSTGPEPMLEVLGRYATATDAPLYIEPNAGIPRLDDQKTTYQITPEEMADFAERFVEIGANIVGSCCGSTPAYTRAIRERIKGRKPVSRHVDPALRLSSRVHTLEIGANLPFAVIGERINPTNRDDLAAEIRDGKTGYIQREAQDQVREGAHLLDLNLGVPDVDEAAFMAKAVQAVENVSKTPLSIDSVNPAAVEAALREAAGKPLINSVNAEEASLEKIIPLAKKYGAGLLCLAVGDGGIPKTAEERLTVLRRIVDRAEAAGIPKRDLICDCLTLTVSAQQKRADETLKAVRMVKTELGLPTVLGVSNISYGLPDRSVINSTFLAMAMSAGLDAAIINPGDARMMETVRAASVLTVRDRDSREYVKQFAKKKKKKKVADAPPPVEGGGIPEAVISGNRDEIVPLVEKALDSGLSALEINEQLLIPAIQEVGGRYDRKEIYLPQMILAAETMQRAFGVLEPHFAGGKVASKGKVVLCTVKGDVHDIGKNIVGLFLKNQGFEVVDLGKDAGVEEIVQTAVDERADVIGLSALMTTTMTEMPKVIEAAHEAGSAARIVVGGAVVTKKYAKDIGADGYAKDGVEAVKVVEGLVQK